LQPSGGPTVWVDDRHAIIRRGMATCLGTEGFRVVGESAGLQPPPDPARLDVLVFEAEAMVVRRAVRLVDGTSARLVATVRSPDESLLCDAIEAGVAAVLLHAELSPATLVATVRAVVGGSATLPRAVLPRLLEHAARVSRSGSGGLTAREREVLRLLAEGEDTRDIAGMLCFSERTVKNIVHDVLMKLNCRNRAHAVALATRQGVI
jgi:DNA-binding NarL/FixJ family response regulator